eukprot:jgi/Hompol1/1856/HPOL_004880-RA
MSPGSSTSTHAHTLSQSVKPGKDKKIQSKGNPNKRDKDKARRRTGGGASSSAISALPGPNNPSANVSVADDASTTRGSPEPEIEGDYSKAKAPPNQIPIAQFWSYFDQFYRSLTEDDLRALITKNDDTTSFLVPPLGRHYTEQWAQEDERIYAMLQEGATNPAAMANREYIEMDDIVFESDMQLGPLSERILSALFQEGVVPDLKLEDDDEASGVAAAAPPIDGTSGVTIRPATATSSQSAGAFAGSSSNPALPSTSASSANTSASTTAAAKPRTRADLSVLEERLRIELEYLGLLSEVDTKPPAPSGSARDGDNDEILTELLQRQNELRTLAVTNMQRKQRVHEVAERWMGWQEYNSLLDEINKNLEQSFSKRFKSSKNKKGKKIVKEHRPLSESQIAAMESRRRLIKEPIEQAAPTTRTEGNEEITVRMDGDEEVTTIRTTVVDELGNKSIKTRILRSKKVLVPVVKTIVTQPAESVITTKTVKTHETQENPQNITITESHSEETALATTAAPAAITVVEHDIEADYVSVEKTDVETVEVVAAAETSAAAVEVDDEEEEYETITTTTTVTYTTYTTTFDDGSAPVRTTIKTTRTVTNGVETVDEEVFSTEKLEGEDALKAIEAMSTVPVIAAAADSSAAIERAKASDEFLELKPRDDIHDVRAKLVEDLEQRKLDELNRIKQEHEEAVKKQEADVFEKARLLKEKLDREEAERREREIAAREQDEQARIALLARQETVLSQFEREKQDVLRKAEEERQSAILAQEREAFAKLELAKKLKADSERERVESEEQRRREEDAAREAKLRKQREALERFEEEQLQGDDVVEVVAPREILGDSIELPRRSVSETVTTVVSETISAPRETVTSSSETVEASSSTATIFRTTTTTSTTTTKVVSTETEVLSAEIESETGASSTAGPSATVTKKKSLINVIEAVPERPKRKSFLSFFKKN